MVRWLWCGPVYVLVHGVPKRDHCFFSRRQESTESGAGRRPGTNNAADVAESLAAGEPIWREKVVTIADGLQGRLGRLTWPLIRDHVDGCIVVSEEEIVEAMKLMFERMKVGTASHLLRP